LGRPFANLLERFAAHYALEATDLANHAIAGDEGDVLERIYSALLQLLHHQGDEFAVDVDGVDAFARVQGGFQPAFEIPRLSPGRDSASVDSGRGEAFRGAEPGGFGPAIEGAP
jgi:hypothetical protein